MQPETTSPADKVISAFGGLTKTSNALNVPVTTVQGWKDRKRIPQDRWAAIQKAAKEAGKTITLEDLLGSVAA